MAVNVRKIRYMKCHEVGRPPVCYATLTKSLYTQHYLMYRKLLRTSHERKKGSKSEAVLCIDLCAKRR